MKRGGRGNRGGMRGRNQPARYFEQSSYVPDEIQNINKELQLLKQKKEIMQGHQHNMLDYAQYYDNQVQITGQNAKQSYYGQDSFDSPGPSWSSRNQSYQNDEPYTSADYIPFGRGKKRPRRRQPAEWSSTEYADGDTSSVVEMFGSRLGPKPARAQPRAGRQEPAAKRAKPNHTAPAKKSQNAPSDQLKRIVPKTEPDAVNIEDHTLRVNRVPSTALNGLLELGLGFVLKQIKLKYANSPNYKSMLSREYYLRRLKSVLRDRIRSMMMDQYIPNYVFVVDQYRKKYPTDTDEEILKSFKMRTKAESTEVEDCKPNLKAAKASQTFFRKNIRNVAKTKLNEMFLKLMEMYNTEVFVGQSFETSPTEGKKPAASEEKKKPPKWNIDLGDVIEKRFYSRFGKYMPIINRILNLQPEFKKEQAELLALAITRDPTMPGAIKAQIKNKPNVEGAAEGPDPLPFTVTVRGIPNLPPQNVMRPFLNNYNPKRIKTHRRIKDFLIVKFDEETNYDNFLQQNGKVVGDCTLEIKVSAVVVKNPLAVQKNETNDTEDKKPDAVLNDNNESLISSDMDSQINDLLSSIRQGEDEKDFTMEGNTESNQEANKENSNEVLINDNRDKFDMTEASDLDGQNSVSNTNDKQDVTTQDNVEVGTISDGKEIFSEINEEAKITNDDKKDEEIATKQETN